MTWKSLVVAVPLLSAGPLPAAQVERISAPRSLVPAAPVNRTAAAETVRAATARAVEELYLQVIELPLGADYTVRHFVHDLDVKEELLKTLRRADQIGGPRWVDAHTCQVRLEISTTRVATTLRQMAAAYPRRTAVSAQQIERIADTWPTRTLTATGSSAGAEALVGFRPGPDPRWERIDDNLRRRALADASDDAARRVIASIAPVVLAGRTTLADAFADRPIGESVRLWLASRPVTRVDFLDDMKVEVALAVDEREFFTVVRAALERQDRVALPKDLEEWRRVAQDFAHQLAPAVGYAVVGGGERAVVNPNVAPADFKLPARPAKWVEEQIGAEGAAAAPAGRGKLKAGLAAEADARQKLRAKLEALEFDGPLTVADAARRSDAVRAALDYTVDAARVHKTDYRADGTVVVHLAADSRDFWSNLRR